LRTPSRRHFLAGATATLGLAGTTAGVTALTSRATPGGTGRRPPNVVLVLADDLGHGELGSYGQRLIRTPRMDQLAAEGLRFTQAYAPAPVCAPSRCSLLTGLHSGHATVRTNPFGAPQASIGDGDTTFAELLRERGYRTACIGKWGFGPEEPHQASHPNSRGFEEFYGYLSHRRAHDFYPETLWENGRRVPVPGNVHGRRVTYAPDLFRDRALDYVRARAGEEDPFLLYLAPNVPHAPSRWLEPAAYADRRWNEADKGHAAQVSHLDALVGDLVDLLRDEGLAEDTVLLVSSDNGPHEEGRVVPERFATAEPLRGHKRNLYEGGIRVPLIAWGPSRVTPGTETTRQTPLTDVLPTLAELAGAEIPEGVDGKSLAHWFDGGGRGPADHRYLYWYRNDPHATPRQQEADGGRGLRVCEAVRQGDWKLVRFAPGRDRRVPDSRWEVELYHLGRDPGEQRDVAALYPHVVDRLVNLAHDAWRDPAPARV
jgi:arylsulfatase A-like enzyme